MVEKTSHVYMYRAQFSIKRHKTKTKPITYQLDHSANLKR